MRRAVAAAAALALGCLFACGERPPAGPLPTLSDYGLYVGALADLQPAAGVVPYDLNTPLFSDYADKYRAVRLPAGDSVRFASEGVFEFPRGTVIAKTFAYPLDRRHPERGRRLLETRILLHGEEGWVGLPYVWDVEQSEAYLELAGDRLDVEWVDADGEPVEHSYMVPNANQCKGCHRTHGRVLSPIGPTAAQLNRDLAYANGTENQLSHWSRVGLLAGAPDPVRAPRMPVWDDPESGGLDSRARAWLDVNCAHCHNPEGPARTTGLDLTYTQEDPTLLGVYKYPVAAGRGSGDSLFGIYPGRPEASILLYRLRSLDPGVMMPELGRGLVHVESVRLIEAWIASMPDPRSAAGG